MYLDFTALYNVELKSILGSVAIIKPFLTVRSSNFRVDILNSFTANRFHTKERVELNQQSNS